MQFDFDTPISRLDTGSSKWTAYPPDVLPLWVADMDFAVAPAILDALDRRIRHPVFGYAVPTLALRETIVAEMRDRYGWTIGPDDIVLLPGVEPGFNMALRALCAPGDGVTVFLPVYRPLHVAPSQWNLLRIDEVLRPDASGTYVADIDSVKASLGRSKALLFCNPHNPVGKVFTRREIENVAQVCLSSGTAIISDEIHCDLLFDGRVHVPIATLGRDVADRCITLMSASKTYNIAGLKTAFAIVTNPALRQRFVAMRGGMVDSVNAIGLEATRAAYAGARQWREALLAYLQGNRDYLLAGIRTRLPGITMHRPEGTFLAWLDCSALRLGEPAYDFFLKRAKVVFSPGGDFGLPGDAFVRLNFGCARSVLEAALGRMEASLAERRAGAVVT